MHLLQMAEIIAKTVLEAFHKGSSETGKYFTDLGFH